LRDAERERQRSGRDRVGEGERVRQSGRGRAGEAEGERVRQSGRGRAGRGRVREAEGRGRRSLCKSHILSIGSFGTNIGN
jgi:hypothetical protein